MNVPVECSGGNTWAGGTGGRDTAGLGGKGGPYRLDAGHAVHQLSQAGFRIGIGSVFLESLDPDPGTHSDSDPVSFFYFYLVKKIN